MAHRVGRPGGNPRIHEFGAIGIPEGKADPSLSPFVGAARSRDRAKVLCSLSRSGSAIVTSWMLARTKMVAEGRVWPNGGPFRATRSPARLGASQLQRPGLIVTSIIER